MIEWYDPSKVLSYNRVVNMVIGERSIGKSYAFKKYPIQKFLKSGKKFIYMRRYKSEMKKVKNYFDDIKNEFPDHEFTVKGWDFYCDGELMGVGFPLSMWQSVKSTSFADYDTIIFDEFIREKDKSGYLPNDVEAFLSVCYTVFRRRKNVRAFCLANSVSVVNPYFLEFNVQLNQGKRFNFSSDKDFKDYVVVENTAGMYTPNFEDLSPFEKMISKMDYGRMALENEFTDDTDTFIAKRSEGARFLCTIKYNGYTMGLWADTDIALMFLSFDHDPSTKKVYPLTLEDHNETTVYMKQPKDTYLLAKLISAFQKGMLRFDNQHIKNMGYEFFKKMNIY